jgi:hypothetical protein
MAVAGSDALASRDRSAADRDDAIDIFLSYAREDQRAAARLSRLLEAAGRRVWWDRRVPAGKTWRFEIEKALRNARCVIVLWSQNSIHSQWVHEEAEEARQAGKLMPVLIERVRPPPGFREVQTADLIGWDESPSAAGFRQLSLDIDAVLDASPSDKAKTAEARILDTTDAEARPKSGRRKIAVALLAAIIVLATGAALISLSWNWRAVVEQIAPSPPVAPGEPAEPAELDSVTPEPPPASADAPPAKASPPVAPGEPAEPAELDSAAPEPPPASTDALPANLPEHDGEQAAPAAPSPKKPELTSGAGVRCGDVLQRLQLGERLSDEDRSYLQRECGR